LPTTRFAPSPTGLLHPGHAFAALTAFEAAREGRFLLRIEDLDAGRARAEFVQAIRDDLAWLGLSWPEPVLQQSTRAAAYQAALAHLEARGLLYPCFCTRREIAVEIAHALEAPHQQASGAAPGAAAAMYPGTCRGLSPAQRQRRIARGDSYALRLDAARAAAAVPVLSFAELGAGPAGERGRIRVDPLRLGDVVLARKDIAAAYHLAVVVDDAFQGVTLVTRGNDLFVSTHVQRLLQALLDLPAPVYAHHRLILDTRGRKLSKRDQAVSLRSLREQGLTADEAALRSRSQPAAPRR
jgi:glutamyl-Q tRNA(Asp) synthetase